MDLIFKTEKDTKALKNMNWISASLGKLKKTRIKFLRPFIHKCESILLSYLLYVTKKHFDIIIETTPNLNKT